MSKPTAEFAKSKLKDANRAKRKRHRNHDASFSAKKVKKKENRTDSEDELETDKEPDVDSTEEETEGQKTTEGVEEGEGQDIKDIKDGDRGINIGTEDKGASIKDQEVEANGRVKAAAEEGGNSFEETSIGHEGNKDETKLGKESTTDRDKKGAKFLDVNTIIQTLQNFKSDEIRRRVDLFR